MAQVFISYSWNDSAIVNSIVDMLKTQGHSIWIDREALRPGDDWHATPEAAIRGADAFIVFLSAHSVTSSNVLREIQFAKAIGKHILPLLINPRPHPDSLRPLLPLGLQYIDLTEEFEMRESLISRLLSLIDLKGKDLLQPGPPPAGGGAQQNSDWGKKDSLADKMGWTSPSVGGTTKSESGSTDIHFPGEAERGPMLGGGKPIPKTKASSGGLSKAKPPSKKMSEPQPAPPLGPEPFNKRFAPRYANAVLLEADREMPLDASAPLNANTEFRLRLDIGKLSPLSAVRTALPIPEHFLPPNIWLDVTVSSTDFAVGRTRADLGSSAVAEGRFFLPSDGSPARTEAGEQYHYFSMRAPQQHGFARARINYYYRNHLVESQLMTANIGGQASHYAVEIDYTLSESLVGLEALPQRNQISILTNDNRDGTHQIVVRAEDKDGNLLEKPITFELNSEAVGRDVRDMRAQMRNEPIAPTQRQRSKDQLKNDLKILAPLGWKLFTDSKLGDFIFDLYPLINQPDLVVQVTRPESSDFAFPWGLVYDIEYDTNQKPVFCKLVENWDGHSPLVSVDTQVCPYENEHTSNTLCPFGFWGYRYGIEQLSKTDEPIRVISAPPAFAMVMGETQYDISKQQLQRHVDEIKKILRDEFSNATLVEGADVNSIQNLLARDTPVIYFYCHGERTVPGSPDTYLGVGSNQHITPSDFISWVKKWWNNGKGVRVWDRIHPLIFVNACHSLEINPDSLVTYLDAFIGTGHAAGVIGTEVRINQALAMEAAKLFFTYFFKGDTAGEALHKVRTDFLASGNLFGLVYTPYCWSDLKICKAQ